MHSHKTGLATAAFLALGFSSASILPAQKLAVEGKTPANPTLIIGIPDSASLWQGISSSPLASKIAMDEGTTAIIPAETRARLKESGNALGIDLTPEGFLTKTISGLDFYLVENAASSNFVANFAFQDATAPARLIDQVRKEAAAAFGVSGGISADTVIVDAATGFRSLYLPAFEIYLAADGNILLYSNFRPALESALENKGQAIFQSDYFARYMASLQGVESQVWMFGEFSELTPILESAAGSGAGEALEVTASFPLGGKLFFGSERIKLTMFRHERDMSASERRFTLSAPPAGDVGIMNFFPDTSVMALGTNHFDAISFLEILSESLDDVEDAPISAADIDARLAGAGALLGFDPKNDLFANLGPDLGIAITAIPDPASASGFPIPEVVFACGVKDPVAFKSVMDQLSGLAAAAAPPPPPAPATPDGQQGQTATPQPPPAPKTETIEGQTVTFAELPGEGGKTQTPAWCLTSDGRFVFASSKEAIGRALSQSRGASGSLLTSPAMKTIRPHLSETRNSLWFIDVEPLMPLLDSSRDMFLEGASEEDKAAATHGIELLRTIRNLSISTKYMPQGKMQEVLLVTH